MSDSAAWALAGLFWFVLGVVAAFLVREWITLEKERKK